MLFRQVVSCRIPFSRHCDSVCITRHGGSIAETFFAGAIDMFNLLDLTKLGVHKKRKHGSYFFGIRFCVRLKTLCV